VSRCRRDAAADVVVIGGGPAGCAAAITASRAGARVVLLERDLVARDRPGETLHPGIEPLLTWLGAADLLPAATLARHEGHWVQSRGDRRFVAFGGDARGTWLGFQAWRQTLDGSLRRRAAELGAEVRLGVAATGVLDDESGRVTGVVTDHGEGIRAPVVVDASGGVHWLARKLPFGVTQLSPRYVATFGYVGPSTPLPIATHRRATPSCEWTAWDGPGSLRSALEVGIGPGSPSPVAGRRLGGCLRSFEDDGPEVRRGART